MRLGNGWVLGELGGVIGRSVEAVKVAGLLEEMGEGLLGISEGR